VELIITDINMPEMNGMSFLRELNRSHPASNVIMITAYGEVESYVEAMNLGAFEYINKPLKVADLKSDKRLKNFVQARQVAIWICRDMTKCSYPDIGTKFGGKDHSTVIYAAKKIERYSRKTPKCPRLLMK